MDGGFGIWLAGELGEEVVSGVGGFLVGIRRAVTVGALFGDFGVFAGPTPRGGTTLRISYLVVRREGF